MAISTTSAIVMTFSLLPLSIMCRQIDKLWPCGSVPQTREENVPGLKDHSSACVIRNGIPMKNMLLIEDNGAESVRGKRGIDLALEPRAPRIVRNKSIVHRHEVNVRRFAGKRADIAVKWNPDIARNRTKRFDKFVTGATLTGACEEHFFS